MTRTSALLLALALVGCSFTEIPPAPGSVAVNRCDENEECNSGRCRDNICVATSTSISTLFVEVTPPTNVPDLGGMPFYARLAGPRGNIAIGPAATVTTTIGASATDACSYEGPPPTRSPYAPSRSTIPASISFVPSARVLGIAAPTYSSSTGPQEDVVDGVVQGVVFRSTTKLPSGTYDMYIGAQLSPGADPSCEIPPLLVRGQEISGLLALTVALPPPTVVNLTVRGPVGDTSLTGWSVEMLDYVTGRVLSAKSQLSAPVDSDAGADYAATPPLAFVPAQLVNEGELQSDPDFDGIEIIRVSPPEGEIAPSFIFEREGLSIFGDGFIVDLAPRSGYAPGSSAFPPIAEIEGQTTEFDTGAPVEAAVTLTATEIKGASDNASFVTTIQVDETGWFKASVPPGKYNVRAVPPPSLGLAAAQASWEISATSVRQAGKTIQIPRAPVITGDATVNNSPVFGATATTVVSPLSVQTNVIERTLEAPPLLPRASSDLIGRDGRFDVPVDPGIYDFFIQPEARSRYPWLVLPHLGVPAGGLNLRSRRVTLPYVYRGDVVVDLTTTRVPGALIRAYVYVTDVGEYTSDVSKAVAVVPVAEARADETGAFELLIPASLDKE